LQTIKITPFFQRTWWSYDGIVIEINVRVVNGSSFDDPF
jgi:hypothetical protein